MSEINILFLGDVVGSPGRRMATEYVPRFRNLGVSFVIANGENAAGGSGLTRATASELFDCGIDVITSGDHFYRNREVLDIIDDFPRLIRPYNFSASALGRGVVTVGDPPNRISVINLIGRVFMSPSDCPFAAMEDVMWELSSSNIIILDMHAEATSEKVAMGRFLDGRIAAVLGTHTHVQTADETILPGGTAYITDVGMTGPYESVIGRDIEAVLETFLTGMPSRFDVAKGDARLSGVLLKVNNETGHATGIRRVHLREGEKPGRELLW